MCGLVMLFQGKHRSLIFALFFMSVATINVNGLFQYFRRFVSFNLTQYNG